MLTISRAELEVAEGLLEALILSGFYNELETMTLKNAHAIVAEIRECMSGKFPPGQLKPELPAKLN